MFAAARSATKNLAFSSVSAIAINGLIGELLLTEVDGFKVAPLETPSGQQPAPCGWCASGSTSSVRGPCMVCCVQATCTAADAAEIDGFDYSKFENKDAGTPAFVEYHRQQLQSCGLSMERGGYSVLDMHETAMYNVQIGSNKYLGGVDGGVVPLAVRQGSAAMLLRIGFIHKAVLWRPGCIPSQQSAP